MQGDEAPLLIAHLNAQVILDDLERAAGEPVLLAVELLNLEEQRVLAGDALALSVEGEGDVVGERDEDRVVDVHVELFAQHLDDILGNRQVNHGNGLKQA